MLFLWACLLGRVLSQEDSELDVKEAENILLKIETIFKELLSSNDETLEGQEFDYRLGIFILNVLNDHDHTVGYYTGPSLNDMYTEDELSLMNGAVMVENMEFKKKFKRRTRRDVSSIKTQPSYDTRRYFKMNDVVSQGLCGNCYVHSIIAALEISYTMLTGELLKFSEQELTDCYHRGCDGGDYRMVAKTLAVTDHLSEARNYGPYLSGKSKVAHTCKAGVSPDGLIKVKVVGVVEVTKATVEHAVTKYGSVMVCLDWMNECKDIGRYTEGVYESKGRSNGCHHAALIVGYTPDYYIVRNSMGKSYGEEGYFKIKRGDNTCGIEQHMAALVVEKRNEPKAGLAPNGCPVSKPFYCTDLYVCTNEHECVTPDKKVVAQNTEKRKRAIHSNLHLSAMNAHSTKWNYKRQFTVSNLKGDVFGDRKRNSKRQLTLVSNFNGDVIGDRKYKDHAKYDMDVCMDKIKACSKQKRWCSVSSLLPRLCPVTCEICKKTSTADLLASVTYVVKELKGPCNIPTIENGLVIADGDKIPTGEYLNVVCFEGYILEGEPVKCVIQDVFSPDSRLLPECVKAGPETLLGKGDHYQGTISVDIEGRTCKSWNKQIILGYATIKVAQSGNVVIGNHNLCRNVGGKMPVPWCYIDDEGNTGFCFKHPGCDSCAGGMRDLDVYCPDYFPWECDYTTPKKSSRPDDRWKHCKKTCCNNVGC